ncbi:MAG: CPBP family intramembrane metalloprotease [Bacteroidales bacterium]|nr:CPBP family intramembrane metalloprotease [Bacteroidales bacterium]
MFPIFEQTSPGRKLLLLVLAILAGQLVGSIIAAIPAIIIGPSNPWTLRIAVAIGSLCSFVLPGAVLTHLYSSTPWSYLGLRRTYSHNFAAAGFIMLGVLPGINLLMSINDLPQLPAWMIEMEELMERQLELMLSSNGIAGYIVNVLVISIMAAFGEEFVFRGLMQRHLTRLTRSQIGGIIITALIFSAIHFQFKGFLARFALGAVLGFLYATTNSLWVPIFAHALNNFMSISAYTVLGKGSDMDTLGSLDNLWPLGVASLAVVVFMLSKLRSAPAPADDAKGHGGSEGDGSSLLAE